MDYSCYSHCYANVYQKTIMKGQLIGPPNIASIQLLTVSQLNTTFKSDSGYPSDRYC